MGGLKKITEQILLDAKNKAQLILKDAENEAFKIREEETKKNDIKKAEFEKKISDDCEKILRMQEGTDRQQARQILLKARREVIDEIIIEAKESVINMQKDKYLEFLKTVLKNSKTDETGEILFAKKDIALIDDKFISECEKISSKLKVSKETADIEHGFIIRYGKIEQNCSIDSIFSSKHNELIDLVNSCLCS